MKISRTLLYITVICLIALLAVSCGGGDDTTEATPGATKHSGYTSSVRVVEITRPTSFTSNTTTIRTTLPTTATATYLQTTVVIGADPQNPLSVPITFKNVQYDASNVGIGPLVIYNAANAQKNSSYIDSLVTIYGNRDASYQLANTALTVMPEVITPLNQMAAAINAQLGRSDLLIRSAYRTREHQLSLYEEGKVKYGAEVDRYVLPPDNSDYRTGYALYLQISINGDSYELDHFRAKDIKDWLDRNASGYGFILRYPAGKSSSTNINEGVELHHYRYVGKPHSIVMNQLGYSLEEYVEYLKQFSYSGKHLCVTAEEANYQIYYIPANATPGEIQVPTNYAYTISGDNVGGYVVTVNTSSPISANQ